MASRISSHSCQNGHIKRHPCWSVVGVFTTVANSRFVAYLGPRGTTSRRLSRTSRNHISQTMWELHWLPIQGFYWKFGMMRHSVVYGTAPEYLRIRLTPVADLSSCRHKRRCAARGLFHLTRTGTRFGSCAFSVAVPKSIGEFISVTFLKMQLKPFFNSPHTLPLNWTRIPHICGFFSTS